MGTPGISLRINSKRGHRVSPQKYKEGKKNSRKPTEKEKEKTSNVFEQLEESFCLEVLTMRLVNTVFWVNTG